MNGRTIAFAAIFVLLSAALVLVTAESGYRVYLRSTEKPPADAPKFAVYSSSVWQYDREVGYTYRASHRQDWAMIEGGLPVRCGSFVTNANGDAGEPVVSEDRAVKVVVLGDSFTAMVHDGMTWPDLLRREVGRLQPGLPVAIRNASRDGYGVLQMTDQAAKLASRPETRPDAFVMAIIAPDLRRHRFWRMEKPGVPYPEVYTSFERDLRQDPESYARAALVNPGVTRAWCEGLMQSKNRADALLAEVHGQYAAALRQDERFSGTRVRLKTLSVCYLCNTIMTGKPFVPIKGRMQSDGISLKRYIDDPEFARSLETVRTLRIPLWLVYLPWEPELRDGKPSLDEKELPLMDDLKSRVDAFIDLVPATGLGDRATALTLQPVDAHPSMEGLRFYAESLAPKLVPLLEALPARSR